LQDPDTRIRDLALRVADQLQIKPIPDDTPKTSSLEPEDLIEKAVSMRGDVTLGEVAFSKANCGMCHTVDSSQTPKGPFLGNIAKTYPRAELARNILDPNRTIAQGFKTEQFLMAGGQVYVGFVTLESAESVTIRDAKGVETLLEKEEIEERVKVATSSMPTGLLEPLTVLEFASLLDYLESLAK
jgi:putative heme-binding domain-containing protein